MWEATLESRISFLNVEPRCLLDIQMEVSEKQSKILVYSRNCELEMEKGPGRALQPHVHGVLGLSFYCCSSKWPAYQLIALQANNPMVCAVLCSAPHKTKAKVLAGQSSRLAPLGGSSVG